MCFSFSVFFLSSFHLFSTYRSKQSKQTVLYVLVECRIVWPRKPNHQRFQPMKQIVNQFNFCFLYHQYGYFFLSLSFLSVFSLFLFLPDTELFVFFFLSLSLSCSCSFFLIYSRETSCSHENSHIHTHTFIYNTSIWHPCFNACVPFASPWLLFVSDWILQRFASQKYSNKIQFYWRAHPMSCVPSRNALLKVIKEIGTFLFLFVFVNRCDERTVWLRVIQLKDESPSHICMYWGRVCVCVWKRRLENGFVRWLESRLSILSKFQIGYVLGRQYGDIHRYILAHDAHTHAKFTPSHIQPYKETDKEWKINDGKWFWSMMMRAHTHTHTHTIRSLCHNMEEMKEWRSTPKIHWMFCFCVIEHFFHFLKQYKSNNHLNNFKCSWHASKHHEKMIESDKNSSF